MKKVLQVLCHILMFPALIGLVIWADFAMIRDEFGNYGIMVLVGAIVAAVMALIYYIAFIANVAQKKKTITRQTISLILVVFFCLGGLWCVVDIALPDILANATSKTLYYEDLVDNYEARMVVNKALLDEYITRNYNNGNLPTEDENGDEIPLDTYLKQGLKNEKVKFMLVYHFKSIDTNGYKSFVAPWIGMANDDRLTIPTLVHLLLDERNWDETIYEGIDYKESMFGPETTLDTQALLDDMEVNDQFKWNVLDMMGTSMEIELSLAGVDFGAYNALKDIIPNAVKLLEPDIAGLTEAVTGSPIYLSYDGKAIKLTPSNESRGVLDYMSMAWLDSNGLLYAVVGLLSIRNIFLYGAAWIILMNFIIGMLRGMGKEEKAAQNGVPYLKGGEEKQLPGDPYSLASYDYYGNSTGYTDTNYQGPSTTYGTVYPIPASNDYSFLDVNQMAMQQGKRKKKY